MDMDITEIQTLEESLWLSDTRFDEAWLRVHIHPEFLEYGRSGRVYDYDSLFPPTAEPIDCTLPLPNFVANQIDSHTVITHYDSHVRYGDTIEHAHRTSIWLNHSQGWQLRFHQGTPYSPES